jgi:cysteine desulfurase
VATPVYLDYNATTPTDPRVFEAMRRYALTEFGNPASQHLHGKTAEDAVNEARRKILRLLSDKDAEIVFTSGATESNNLALLGLTNHGQRSGRVHVLASAIEHRSVLGPLAVLERGGFDVEFLPVSGGGHVDPDDVRSRLRSDTLVLSLMHANNETGVLQPVREIAHLVRESGALFHVDAAQTFGKEISDLMALDYDLLSISAHKVFGPKGVGALVINRTTAKRVRLSPLMHGGRQQWGLRPGTLPVPLIVGLGVAAEFGLEEGADREKDAICIRREFESHLAAVDHVINGDPARTQKHVLNVSFPGVDSEALMLVLKDSIAISNGSACSSGNHRPSHVLTAMGLSHERIASAVRFSWGAGVGEIPYDRIIDAVRGLSYVRL